MKKLLSLLMCYVFLQAETFALRGGPNQAGGPKVSGAYSGVIIDTGGSGGVGLFLLNAANGGASSGQMVIFSQSAAGSESYNCTIIGLSDTSRGGSGKFIGVFHGTSAGAVTGTTQTISGQMTLSSVVRTGATQRLTGTANSTTQAIATGGTVAVVGPLVTYSADGWLTNSNNNTGLVLP